MKRIITIIVVTSIMFLVAFLFLRLENEDAAHSLIDDVGLNSKRIRNNKINIASGSTLSGEVLTGSVMTGEILTGTILSGDVGTGVATGN